MERKRLIDEMFTKLRSDVTVMAADRKVPSEIRQKCLDLLHYLNNVEHSILEESLKLDIDPVKVLVIGTSDLDSQILSELGPESDIKFLDKDD